MRLHMRAHMCRARLYPPVRGAVMDLPSGVPDVDAPPATRSAAMTDDVSGERAAVDAPGLEAGELVGRYRVRRPIGEGGMGRVYLARDVTLGRSVALKVVRGG